MNRNKYEKITSFFKNNKAANTGTSRRIFYGHGTQKAD